MHLATEARFGLTPMQSGMLFQWMLGQSGSDPTGFDLEQIHLTLSEPIDVAILARAFNRVVERHDSLRCSFHWQDGASPYQQPANEVDVPVHGHDWRALTSAQRALARGDFLWRDRQSGFDLSVAPLMRVAVFACAQACTEIVWTVHHIVVDGRSFAPLLQRIFAVYDALRDGTAVPSAASERPFRDFVAWVGAQDTAASLAFFRRHLQGFATPTPLPFAQPGVSTQPAGAPGRSPCTLPAALAQQVRALAEVTGTRLAIVMQAALALVLARLTDSPDVVFGAVRNLHRRFAPEATQALVGLLINTLPVRVVPDDHATVAELLQSLALQNQQLRAHSHVSLIDIQGVSEVPRGTPLFETLLMFDSQEINQSLRASGHARWLGVDVTVFEQPPVPLTLTVFGGDSIQLYFLFDRRRFTQPTIDRLASAFVTVLDQLSQGEARRLADVDALTPEERYDIVHAWNATARPYPDALQIHQLFEQQVQARPDAIAVEMEGAALSYRALDRRANQLACVLRRRGAGVRRYIGICLDRSIDLVVAMLAVAKSGSPYLPLDPAYPIERLNFMLQDADALLVVTQAHHTRLFVPHQTLVIDAHDAAEIAASPDLKLPRVGSASDVCYAIFTSGSTGKPKGVVLCHQAVVNTFDWVSRTHGIGSGDRLLFVTSPCFDLSVYDVFGVLGAGATVVVASSALLADPQRLAQALVTQAITVWDSAPAALQRLTPYFPAPGNYPLRLVMLSGDWIPLTLPGALRAAFVDVAVTSLGGATEAAIWSNAFKVETIEPGWISIPYGKPIQNAVYHVLDGGLRPAPVGVAGDLYIGGVCLAQGYLNRPELTAERFIANPLPDSPCTRLYKTGDRARYWEDGNLEFLGRADFQVKIRGFRVELGEIEAALLALPAVRDAVCVASADGSGQKTLVAYVILVPGTDSQAGAIKSLLAHRLPDYMIPAFVVALASFPVSANGKLDRKALPSPQDAARETAFSEPQFALEKDLARIWQDVLRCGPVGLDDNFFDLGGHSLLAVTLIARLRRDLGITLPLSGIVAAPTVRRLAHALRDGSAPRPVFSSELLILLRQGGTANLFLIHEGFAGHAVIYQDLALRLPAQFSVYGIVPRHLPNIPMIDTRIEAMAASYLAHIRQVQPTGPYHLGGLCSGGVIAYEMALQLQAMGETVGLVAIMDAVEPQTPPTPKPRQSAAPSDAQSGRRPVGFALSALAAKTRQAVMGQLPRWSTRTRLGVLKVVLKTGLAWPKWLAPLSVEDIYLAAKARYRPGELHQGQVLVLIASAGEGSDEPEICAYQDDYLGWRRVVRCSLEAVPVAGGHFSMLQAPHVDVISAQIAQRLSRF